MTSGCEGGAGAGGEEGRRGGGGRTDWDWTSQIKNQIFSFLMFQKKPEGEAEEKKEGEGETEEVT